MSTILEIEIYKLNQIASVLQDEGYEKQSLEIASIAHDLELKLHPHVAKAEFPENFE